MRPLYLGLAFSVLPKGKSMLTTTDLLPVIITTIAVGVALAGFMFTVMLVFFRMLNQRVTESEERVTRLISESEERVTRLITETDARLTRLISETEARLTVRIDANGQRIDNLESRMQRVEQETAEIKGALTVIQNALPIRIGD